MNRKLLRVAGVAGILLLCFTAAVPVNADQADPDSTPTVEDINVYRNLLETGDRLYLIYANTPYATTPDVNFPHAFVWRLFDTDNTTELGSTVGYAYGDADGYGYNVFSMYFAASDNLTWEENYILRLSGNPSVFDVPPYYDYPVSISDYTTLTDSDDNQDALAVRILELAHQLDIRWGLDTDYSLLLETEAGTVLSIYGESFFRGAIYGVQALAPNAFRLVVGDLDATDRTWDTEYAENLTEQYAGTWIEPAKTGGGTMFGVGYDLMSIILSMVCAAMLIWGNMKITSDHWNALIDVSILLVTFPYIDLIPLSFTALVCAIFAIYEGTRVKSMVS